MVARIFMVRTGDHRRTGRLVLVLEPARVRVLSRPEPARVQADRSRPSATPRP